MLSSRRVIENLLFVFLLTLVACNSAQDKVEIGDEIYSGVEFQMPKVIEPGFSEYTVSITEFNAVPGGQVLNTKAIADAIHNVVSHGGGKVVIPRGIWLTGPIVLQSNVNLHAEAGALVIFSTNKDLYPLVETSFEGLNTVRCQSPIYGKDLENIAITGDGVFDGSGDVWRMVKKSKLTESQWKKLVATGGFVDEKRKIWYPSESFKKGVEISDMNVPKNFDKLEDYTAIRDFLRPVMVSFG